MSRHDTCTGPKPRGKSPRWKAAAAVSLPDAALARRMRLRGVPMADIVARFRHYDAAAVEKAALYEPPALEQRDRAHAMLGGGWAPAEVAEATGLSEGQVRWVEQFHVPRAYLGHAAALVRDGTGLRDLTDRLEAMGAALHPAAVERLYRALTGGQPRLRRGNYRHHLAERSREKARERVRRKKEKWEGTAAAPSPALP